MFSNCHCGTCLDCLARQDEGLSRLTKPSRRRQVPRTRPDLHRHPDGLWNQGD